MIEPVTVRLVLPMASSSEACGSVRQQNGTPGWNTGPMSTGSSRPSNDQPSPLRARITKASYPYVRRLHGMPKLTLPAITLVLALVGVVAPPVAAVPALILLALLLAWLGFLSWPVVGSGSRAMRIFAVLVVLLYAVSRLAEGS
jgi:uncharacterized protein DUF6703